MEAFQKSITDFVTVGESIAQVSATHCQTCGVASHASGSHLMQCSGCKIIKYCSAECQKKDWAEGHQDECAVIQEKLPWTALADEIMAGPPIPGSIIDRHLARFEPAEIGRRFGGGVGFGVRGLGGAGLGFRGGGGGFRGAVRTPVGSMRLGLRGPGYSSRSFFRPRYSGGGGGLRYRWGRGLGFGGYRWGLWGGWRFPWLFANGMWYPWWFYLDPVYYQMRRPYIDPLTGVAYGVPPYAPGTWGSVGAPPGGVGGYAEVPIAPGASMGLGLGVNTTPIFASVDQQQEQQQDGEKGVDLIDAPLGVLLKRIKGRARGTRKFRRLVMRHTVTEMRLADEKAMTDRNIVTSEWAEAVSGVTGAIVRMLNEASLLGGVRTGYKTAGELLALILADHDTVLVRVANGLEKEAALDRFAQKWSEFWAAVSIDPVWITLNASGKSTLREVIASAPGAAETERILFADARRHSLAILSYMRGYETREECYDAAEAMGGHLDAYMSLSPHRHAAIFMSIADIQAAWSLGSGAEAPANVTAAASAAPVTNVAPVTNPSFERAARIEAQLKKGLSK